MTVPGTLLPFAKYLSHQQQVQLGITVCSRATWDFVKDRKYVSNVAAFTHLNYLVTSRPTAVNMSDARSKLLLLGINNVIYTARSHCLQCQTHVINDNDVCRLVAHDAPCSLCAFYQCVAIVAMQIVLLSDVGAR